MAKVTKGAQNHPEKNDRHTTTMIKSLDVMVSLIKNLEKKRVPSFFRSTSRSQRDRKKGKARQKCHPQVER